MYLRLINVKAIERQRDSYILVINNRYEKMGESLYRINKDALEIIRNLNGTKTFDDLVDMMISCHLEKKEQAKYKLNNFLNELEKNPGISVEYLKKTNPIEIPILGNGKTQYPSAISVEITHRCNAKCLSRVEIRKIIQKLKEEGKTILITSHDLSEIEKSADYVTMIENGKVVFNEDIDNIKGTTLEELFIKEGGDYE